MNVIMDQKSALILQKKINHQEAFQALIGQFISLAMKFNFLLFFRDFSYYF